MIGRILRDPDFPFQDGTEGNKRFVILCKSQAGDWIVARTTSQSAGRQWVVGCSLTDGYPSFFIPRGSALFELDTWICLDYLIELDPVDLRKRIDKAIIDDLGEIEKKLLCEILACVYKSQDISNAQADAIRDAMDALCN